MARAAFVAWGSAGREFRVWRVSKGWSKADVLEANRPTPEGVGVKGGGFKGDSEGDAALRFLGRGVTGAANDASGSATTVVASLLASSDDVVVGDALALRFFDVTVGLVTFSYFATPFWAFASEEIPVLLLATLADRLSDMLYDRYAMLVNRVV